MSPSKPALVVVDAQNGFVTEHSAHVIPVIRTLVERWLAADLDVLFTRYINYPNSPFERIMGWSRFKAAPEIDIVDELQPYTPHAIATVDKNIYTLFTKEGEDLVRARGLTDLYLCGIDTEVCVLKTAVDAFERDITPWVIADASASHAGTEAHNAGLLVAAKMIGQRQIINVDSADPMELHPATAR